LDHAFTKFPPPPWKALARSPGFAANPLPVWVGCFRAWQGSPFFFSERGLVLFYLDRSFPSPPPNLARGMGRLISTDPRRSPFYFYDLFHFPRSAEIPSDFPDPPIVLFPRFTFPLRFSRSPVRGVFSLCREVERLLSPAVFFPFRRF